MQIHWNPERIKALRESLGLTQKELALELGYRDKASVSLYERGARVPNPRIAKVLDALAERETVTAD